MHRCLTTASRRRVSEERGVVALLMALFLTSLLIVTALVLDFGLVRVDRQVNKSAADAAAVAGLQGLSSSSGTSRPFRGVCTALRYLKQNDPRFAGISDTAGTWTDANGGAKANGCTTAALQGQTCAGSSQATWARFTQTVTWQDKPITVLIQSGYRLDVGAAAWSEESLPAVQADNVDEAQGCNQLAVIITQSRKPGLGSLATTSDLVSSIRTVGRVKLASGGDAPAMLILKRTGCPVLSTGSNSGGSKIWVSGAISSDGKAQAGTIHADTTGTGCTGGSNQSIFLGKAGSGIVTYAAPLVGSPLSPDPSKPGQMTSVAGDNGVTGTVIRDTTDNAYGSAALNAAGAAAAAKNAPTGRPLVTRKPVDERYLAGVTSAVSGAQSSVFNSLTAANAVAAGYTVVANCNPTGTITAPRVFVDCTAQAGYTGTATIAAETVVFNGRVAPSGTTSLPIAKKVYIFGVNGKPAIDINGGTTAFTVHTGGNPASTPCSEAPDEIDPTNKAIIFVRDGEIKQAMGATLRLCKTTMIMMGGYANACLPAVGYAIAAPPTDKPCNLPGPAAVGTGQLSLNGGAVDWTAPNQHDVMTLTNGDVDPTKSAAWSDPNGPEDLAFWSESGVSSSKTYSLGGTATLRTVGVYMVPNADPFEIGGGACQVLKNAQYIASSIALNGTNTCVQMSVDPNSAVTLPKLKLVGLVR